MPLSSHVAVRSGIAHNGDIELYFEDLGNEADPAVLLIMGVAAQLPMWPDGFCQQLLDAGYRVIRFDNRDCGLSTKLDGQRAPGSVYRRVGRYILGLSSPAPYTLLDMSDDAVSLLNCLGIDKAHIVGASMGGMIAQVLAGSFPSRVLSAGIVYSSTGKPFSRLPAWRLVRMALDAPGRGASADELLEFEVDTAVIYNGPDNLPSRDALRQRILDHRARSNYPVGTLRQFDAILGTGNLLRYVRAITAPTVVIHGRNDPLIPFTNGRAVAKNVPGSRFVLVDGMGHDLPEPLWSPIVRELLANFDRAYSA